MKYMIKEVKYEFISKDVMDKVFFIIGCIILFGVSLLFNENWHSGHIGLYYMLINSIITFTNKPYSFGEDAYRLLPFSQKEYHWMFILEGIPFQFIVSAIVSLFALPSLLIQGNLGITVQCFVCVLSMGLWFRQCDWLSRFSRVTQKTKHFKRWVYVITEMIVSFLYMGIFIFNLVTEMNIYFSALLSIISIFIILAAVGLIRNYWIDKLDEFCSMH